MQSATRCRCCARFRPDYPPVLARDLAEWVPAHDLAVDVGCGSGQFARLLADWFDLPRFYREVRRVEAPGALLALISYGVPHLEAGLDERLQRFYSQEIGPYWPPGRSLVEEGYRTLDFPFREITVPPLRTEKQLPLSELLGYISTWSAVRAAREAGVEEIFTEFTSDLTSMWGDPATPRIVSWPITMRVGVV